ncbi:MAG: Nicotinate dehydrogenase small FeS subunit [Chloroflexi bacterium ADurb.Bin360]|nr:MAG: Nicotinate dehydrogenase small FeS subunit [Chloroflexi bacterium ADurb.Bin360]
MLHEMSLNINGETYPVVVKSHDTLVRVLREQLGLTGTKVGCGNGECGACTVLFDGAPVNSCMVLAVEAQGHRIETVEGLSQGGDLHPLQKAFVEHNAVQCGFCTSGMLMSAKALLERNSHPTEQEVREALVGNLCRCTGYIRIVDAVLDVAEAGS